MLLSFTQLRATSYRRMLGTPQTGVPQDQRRDSRIVPARNSKKPTPKPQREGCSSGGNLCRPRGGRRRKSNPAYGGHYHFTVELQIQKSI